MQSNQIKQLDYFSLVNMLLGQISPEVRSTVLIRLTEMNDRLLSGMQSGVQPDLSRAGALNSRKKDLTEIQHPSLDQYSYKGHNPIPLNFPCADDRLSMDPSASFYQQNNFPRTDTVKNKLNIFPNNKITEDYNYKEKEIDLDEIIDDIGYEQDYLDDKLLKIKNLHNKIISDKKRRRREKDATSRK